MTPATPEQASAVTILGGGSWGSALAWLLGEKGISVRLWCRDAAQAREMAVSRRNERYLSGVPLPPPVLPSSDLTGSLGGARVIVLAVPAQALRETVRLAVPHLDPQAALVIAAKGLERDTGKRLSDVVSEERGTAERLAVLSGPNLSDEIVRGIPTTTVVACREPELGASLRATFATPTFRVYGNPDLCGVELGGALKNPIAIAAGITDGMGYGNNTKASLITRGLAEITRLGVAAGGQAGTFDGLSGLGDLVATAYSPLSRNYRLGLALGRGTALEQAQQDLGHVAEGVPTSAAACHLAEQLGIEVPILRELRGVLFDAAPVPEAIRRLMTRPYRDEERE